jgi:hypothetical protein
MSQSEGGTAWERSYLRVMSDCWGRARCRAGPNGPAGAEWWGSEFGVKVINNGGKRKGGHPLVPWPGRLWLFAFAEIRTVAVRRSASGSSLQMFERPQFL